MLGVPPYSLGPRFSQFAIKLQRTSAFDPFETVAYGGFREVQHSAIVHVSREAHNPRIRRGRLVLAEVHVGLLLLVGEHAGRVLVSERYRLPSSRPLIVC